MSAKRSSEGGGAQAEQALGLVLEIPDPLADDRCRRPYGQLDGRLLWAHCRICARPRVQLGAHSRSRTFGLTVGSAAIAVIRGSQSYPR